MAVEVAYVDHLLAATTATYSIANRDNTGADGNGYKTIQAAFTALALLPLVDGALVHIRAGYYFGTGNLLDFSDNAATTLQNYANETIQIGADSSIGGNPLPGINLGVIAGPLSLKSNGTGIIRLDGRELDVSMPLISFAAAANVTFRRILHKGKSTSWSGSVTNMIADRCRFHDVRVSTPASGDGINLESTGGTFTDLWFQSVNRYGMNIVGDNNVFNKIMLPVSYGLPMTEPPDTQVPGAALRIAGNNNIVKNPVLSGGFDHDGDGIDIVSGLNNAILNGTIIGAGVAGDVGIRIRAAATGTKVINTILGQLFILVDDGVNSEIHHNVTDPNVNPGLWTYDQYQAGDYRPNAGSAILNTGIELIEVLTGLSVRPTNDGANFEAATSIWASAWSTNARPQSTAFDIGAFEGQIATPPIQVDSISPNWGLRDTSLQVTIVGANFSAGDAVLTFDDPEITVDSYVSRTATQIVANISISATADLETAQVIITNPDTSFGSNIIFVVGEAGGETPLVFRVVRVSDDVVMATGIGVVDDEDPTKVNASFTFLGGEYGVEYQLQWLGPDGFYSTEGCVFSFDEPAVGCPETGELSSAPEFSSTLEVDPP